MRCKMSVFEMFSEMKLIGVYGTHVVFCFSACKKLAKVVSGTKVVLNFRVLINSHVVSQITYFVTCIHRSECLSASKLSSMATVAGATV